jgi:hypothetical protein
MRSRMVWINVGLRAVMESGIVLGFAFWGYHVGDGPAVKLLFAAGAVVLGFGFWGAVDFREAGRWAERLRLLQELFITASATAAWWAAGWPDLGIAVAVTSIVYHMSVYASGNRLLRTS